MRQPGAEPRGGDAHGTRERDLGGGSLQLHLYSFDRHADDERQRAGQD
jgi:hypothetical protein